MKTKAAVLWSAPGKWEVTDVDLDEPKEHEALVRIMATGLCHSDDHVATGDAPVPLPVCGGHEGAGVVEAVGSAVEGLRPGDHVLLGFLPACGHCRWCATGLQNLCDNGAFLMAGTQLDGTYRMHKDGQDIGQMALISTFSELTVVPAISCVKIPDDIPFIEACLVGCGVPTGWGSAVNSAQVEPGDVTIVMGVGGVGMNAVQGAAHAGASHIIAVDPVGWKRDRASEFGATDACETIEEATELARSLTNGQGADNVVVAVGVTTGEHVSKAFSAIRKAGTVVVTGVGSFSEFGIPVSLIELTMYQKRIQGSLCGSTSPTRDIPRLLSLYGNGQLKLSELVSRTYSLDQINEGYADMHAGRNIRGVITFE